MLCRQLRKWRLPVLSIVLVLVCAAAGSAQAIPPPAKFILEVTGGKSPVPFYSRVYAQDNAHPDKFSLFSDNILERLPDWPANAEVPSVMEFDLEAKADLVSMTATVYYGASMGDAANYSKSDGPNRTDKLKDIHRQVLGTHTARLNEAIIFSEFATVGLHPMTLRVLPPQAEVPYRPAVRSNAPSVTIEYQTVDRLSGTATVHNHSAKAVNAFELGGCREDGSCNGTGFQRSPREPLIAPGASTTESQGIERSGQMVNGSYVEGPKPTAIVLQAVLFDDGSFEGSAEDAAHLAVSEFARQVQRKRIAAAMTPILAAAEPNDEAVMGRIQNATKQLSTMPDVDVVAELHACYPTIPEGTMAEFQPEMAGEMKGEMQGFSQLLESNFHIYQHYRKTNPDKLTLKQFLQALIDNKAL
jgi:hypothetical protein